MEKSHKTCMEQAEIIDTFGTYHRLRGPERPVYQPRDHVFWYTALPDIELNSFLLTKIGVHEVYYNDSGDTACSSV